MRTVFRRPCGLGTAVAKCSFASPDLAPHDLLPNETSGLAVPVVDSGGVER